MEINSNSASSNSDSQNRNKKTHNRNNNKNNPKALNDDNLNKKSTKFKRLPSDNSMPLESSLANSANTTSNNNTTQASSSLTTTLPTAVTTKTNKNVIKKQTVSVKTKMITATTTNHSATADFKSTSSTSSSSSSSNLSELDTINKFKPITIEATACSRRVTLNDRSEIKIIDENALKNIDFIKPSEFFSSSTSNTSTTITSLAKVTASKSVDSSAPLSKTQPLSECLNNKTETNLRKLEAEFENNFIFKVKKDSKQNDQPKYQCEICSYFCNSIDIVNKHMASVNHKNNLESMRIEMQIRDLEIPSISKINNLSSFLIDFYTKNVISSSSLNQRYEIFYNFKSKFLQKYPNSKVNIYGSTAYGICFNDSQVDIDIEPSKQQKSSSQVLKDVADLIKCEMADVFELSPLISNTNIKSNKSNNNVNKLSLETRGDSKILFNFTCELFKSAFKTSYLIKAYLDLDERAKVLAFCLRYIAKIAMIDKVDLCTLPPHAYILMVIYFLQKLSPPVLPILHETINSSKNLIKKNLISNNVNKSKAKSLSLSEDFLSENHQSINNVDSSEQSDSDDLEQDRVDVKNFDIFKKNIQSYLNGKHWKSTNTDQLGCLWLKLLAFYSIDFGFKKTFISVRTLRRIPKSDVKMYTKKLAIEDPFLLKQSLSRNLLTQTNKYIIHCISKACLHFVNNTHNIKSAKHAENVGVKNSKIVDKLIEETGILEAKKKNKDFMSTYDNLEDDENDEIDESDDNENENDEDDDDDDDEIEFEDDEETYFNNFQETNDKLIDLFNSNKKLKNRNKLMHRTSKSSESDSNYVGFCNREKLKFEKKLSDNLDKILKLDFNSDMISENFTTTSTGIVTSSSDTASPTVLNAQDETKQVSDCLKDMINKVVYLHETIYDQMPNVNLKSLTKDPSFNPTICSLFKLTIDSLGFQKCPPKMCSLCNKEGHLDKECPQDCLPKLEVLPKMTDNWRTILDYVTLQIMEDNQQTKKEEAERNFLFERIKSIVYKKYSDANLSLFGSSNNGFGMKKSDLDICMTLESNPTNADKSLNFKKIIRVIGGLFRADHEFDSIEERTSAKVPIVKFRHKKTNVEGDISLYNTLALQNTELIRAYATIDERTKTLGHVVKHFAKICNIGDASCGSLSSYAYIVMVIHYLMNTSPPVLPCLQKLNRDKLPKKETTLNIDGWDCWFNKDIQNLEKLWPYYKKNTQSIGDLWLGFLCYYTEVFDWDNNVVCIRDNEVLTRRAKNWTKHRLAIEDPFELSHNLAAGVSHKMGLYILKSFAKARFLFGNVIHDFHKDELRLNMDYFFNPKSLVDGVPPIGRNCYTCNKIGHQTRDCPIAINMRKQRLIERKSKPENRRFLSESNDDYTSSIVCYKCRNTGHIARDCAVSNDIRIQKPTFNNTNLNLTEQRCYSCNQPGHFSRDCKAKQNFTQSQQQQQQQTQSQSQQQRQFQQIIKQQSAPQPKMIHIVNTSPNLNPPVLLKTSDNNFQILVNKNDTVISNYQNFYLNQEQQFVQPQNSNANFQQYQQIKNGEIIDTASSLNSPVYNHSTSFPTFNLNRYNQHFQYNNTKTYLNQNIGYQYYNYSNNYSTSSPTNNSKTLNEIANIDSENYFIQHKKNNNTNHKN